MNFNAPDDSRLWMITSSTWRGQPGDFQSILGLTASDPTNCELSKWKRTKLGFFGPSEAFFKGQKRFLCPNSVFRLCMFSKHASSFCSTNVFSTMRCCATVCRLRRLDSSEFTSSNLVRLSESKPWSTCRLNSRERHRSSSNAFFIKQTINNSMSLENV